jgi:hypothetical protein
VVKGNGGNSLRQLSSIVRPRKLVTPLFGGQSTVAILNGDYKYQLRPPKTEASHQWHFPILVSDRHVTLRPGAGLGVYREDPPGLIAKLIGVETLEVTIIIDLPPVAS